MGTTRAIHAARAIIGGDFTGARAWLGGQRAFTVAEARALGGALRFAHERLGAPSYSVFQFASGAVR